MKLLAKTRGFTIVELIVVIVVIAILAATATFAYTGVTSSARDKAVLADADKVSSEVARYGTKNNGRYGAAIQWYSENGANTNIRFTPTSGNIVDVVSDADNYCIRVYNPASGKYKTLQTAAAIGSSNSACASQQPSTVAQNANVQFTSITWQQATAAGSRNWVGVTSSVDGQQLAAVAQSNYVYTSSDGGANWQTRTSSGSRTWMGINSSADGSKLIASSRNYLFFSSDYGVTWTQLTSAGNRDWRGVTISSNGAKIAAQVAGGYIYTSVDSGTTWVERTSAGSRTWQTLSGSMDGATLLATSISSGDHMLSKDSGVTWASAGNASGTAVYGSDVSDNGTVMAMTTNGINVSQNNGLNWTVRTGGLTGTLWHTVDLSGDGTKMIISKGYVYASTNGGQNFTLQEGIPLNTQNYDIDTSTNGAKIIISGWAGYIYIGSYQ